MPTFNSNFLKMTAKIVYTGQLHTECTHLASGTKIETDAPTDNHGKGECFSPTDLLATSLGTCMLTTIAIRLGSDVNIDGCWCDVEKVMVSNPRRIGAININVYFPGEHTYTDEQKQQMEQIALTCPVYLSLHPDVKKTTLFHW
jgi:putative redox protein